MHLHSVCVISFSAKAFGKGPRENLAITAKRYIDVLAKGEDSCHKRFSLAASPTNQNLHDTLRPCKFLFSKVFGRGYRGNLFSKRFPLMRSQKQKEMTLDRRLTHTRPRVTSVRSWYLTSFVILSFYCLSVCHTFFTVSNTNQFISQWRIP